MTGLSGVHGLHHVTCIAGNAQENFDFYSKVLGMRLVKKSVNQDAPDTYHLFYADGAGTPGTDLTFFSWPQMQPARRGIGHCVEVALAVPPGSLDFWRQRLQEHGVTPEAEELRFDERTLPFADPHGLRVALVEADDARPFVAWENGPVPPQHQVRGLHAARLWERSLSATAALLTGSLGLTSLGEENGWHRYGIADERSGAVSGSIAEVRELPEERRGQWGVGGVHHVAWRTRDAAHELALRARLSQAGTHATELIDRFWFESIYFKEPGGVLFELATDGPGFDRDENAAHLGEQLILPPWLESDRAAIEAALPPLVTA